jgi:nascent polypeptide-associated complex subunit alpha
MMPGMGRMNPRQVKQAMKKLGISTEEIEGVEEVIIRTSNKEYVIKDAQVSCMIMQGQRTYQVVGEEIVRERTGEASKPKDMAMPEEDILLVMDQTGKSREQATQALKECGGQPAEAIIKMISS